MKNLLAAAALAVAVLVAGASAQAVELFNFEFRAGGPHHIGTDSYRHYNDFRHNNDYYKNDGFINPYQHTSCREDAVRDGEGTRRITCRSKPSTSSVPGR